jgi:preprotein translocase subunit SecG
MEQKDLIDLLSKKADIIYKKIIILIAASGGSGSYAISTDGLAKVGLFLLFGFFITGIIINYFELNRVKKQFDKLEESNDG